MAETLTENPAEIWSPTVDVEALRYDPHRPVLANELDASVRYLGTVIDRLEARIAELEASK